MAVRRKRITGGPVGTRAQEVNQRVADAHYFCHWAGRSKGGVSEALEGCQEGKEAQEGCQEGEVEQEACYWEGRSIGGVSDGCSSIIEFHLAAAAQEGCQEGVEAQESFSDEKKQRGLSGGIRSTGGLSE